jgi:hypothetical protein
LGSNAFVALLETAPQDFVDLDVFKSDESSVGCALLRAFRAERTDTPNPFHRVYNPARLWNNALRKHVTGVLAAGDVDDDDDDEHGGDDPADPPLTPYGLAMVAQFLSSLPKVGTLRKVYDEMHNGNSAEDKLAAAGKLRGYGGTGYSLKNGRAGNEQCSLSGEHAFVLVDLFGVWRLNVFSWSPGLCGGASL